MCSTIGFFNAWPGLPQSKPCIMQCSWALFLGTGCPSPAPRSARRVIFGLFGRAGSAICPDLPRLKTASQHQRGTDPDSTGDPERHNR
jgi:hypothetical protein